MFRSVAIIVLSGSLLAAPPPSRAQAQSTESALASWVALDAPTGHEEWATGPLAEAFRDWTVDRNGNLYKTVGNGRPHRVVACGLDAPAMAVSHITDDGYLRLHRIGRGSSHPLWDQAHEAQQVRILTAAGPVVGVVAIANGHFSFQHRNETAVLTADDLWLDVGAESRAEVEKMGIQILDPVIRHIPAWPIHNHVAGSNAGARVGCAAVVSAAEGDEVAEGSVTYALTTQQVFGWLGLGGLVTRAAPVDEVVMVGPGSPNGQNEIVPPTGLRRLAPVFEAAGVSQVRTMGPAVTRAGALVEVVAMSAAEELRGALREAIGLDSRTGSATWVAAPLPTPVLNGGGSQIDGNERIERVHGMLDALAETPGVPTHEGPVRALVLEAMPDWARDRVETDDMGNVWLAVGPPGDTVVFMAHMDEVGWTVESVAEDGTVSLRRRGGVIPSAWEGQPARLQLDPGDEGTSAAHLEELNGVFSTRGSATGKHPQSVTAWFGMNGAELEAAGVRQGAGVTGYKEGHRMGLHRYTARSLDDRAGTTALLLALQDLNPDELDHTVILSWSVQEEGGLLGAGALAQLFGATSRKIYSVDTFVSSDTPLESTHFAYAPLGSGPVLRSIENSGMATRAEKAWNLEIAQRAGIEVQVGLTQGGTDGTMFTFWGAPNSGLSWPGRYSHSPAEVLDLRDLADLVDLAGAMIRAVPDPPEPR